VTSAGNIFPSEPSRVPPRLNAATPERRWLLFVGGVVALGIGLTLYFFNPSLHGFYPRCFLYEATGILCPGCGGLRATHQLLHGHVLEALHLNALFVFSLPVAAVWTLQKLFRRRVTASAKSARWLWVALASAIIFTMLRNLPAFTWLAP